MSKPKDAGLPTITGTEAWGRRVLNTQLFSWAELRHDTILYAKQSVTSIPGCAFPTAYVDPYPAVFARLEACELHLRQHPLECEPADGRLAPRDDEAIGRHAEYRQHDLGRRASGLERDHRTDGRGKRFG